MLQRRHPGNAFSPRMRRRANAPPCAMIHPARRFFVRFAKRDASTVARRLPLPAHFQQLSIWRHWNRPTAIRNVH